MSQKFSEIFLPKLKKLETGKFVFCLVAFDLIELLKHLASQNDPQNLSFVKDKNAVGKKMTRNYRKMAKHKVVFFELTQTIFLIFKVHIISIQQIEQF